MNWGVDNLQVLVAYNDIGSDRKSVYLVKESLVNLLADYLNECRIACELDILDLDALDVLYCVNIVWREHLCTIVPVCLVAIVLLWIVAGSDVHTALAAQVADCK